MKQIKPVGAFCLLLLSLLLVSLTQSASQPKPGPSPENMLSLLSETQLNDLRQTLAADGVYLSTQVAPLQAAPLPNGTWKLTGWYSFRPDMPRTTGTDKLCAIRCEELDYYCDLVVTPTQVETFQSAYTRLAHPLSNQIEGQILHLKITPARSVMLVGSLTNYVVEGKSLQHVDLSLFELGPN